MGFESPIERELDFLLNSKTQQFCYRVALNSQSIICLKVSIKHVRAECQKMAQTV